MPGRSKLSKFVSNAGQKSLQNVVRKVGPISTLDMGDFKMLRGVSAADRKTHLNVIDKIRGFEQLRLHPSVKELIGQNILKSRSLPPTPVQKVAIKALRKKDLASTKFQSWMIAAETGSGKTLSYVAPMISNLLEQHSEKPEVADLEKHTQTQSLDSHNEPRISNIVLVPTVELADQVCNTLRGCSPSSVRIGIFAGVHNALPSLAKQVTKGVDVAVASPDKLLRLGEDYPVLMRRALESCSMLVVDEADSLMNQSFEASTSSLISKCPELQHLVFVTATIPKSFDKTLRKQYPETNFLVTPSIHRLPRHIEFRVVEVWHRPYNNNKALALQQALFSIYHDKTEDGKVKRVVVFVNRKSDVDNLVSILKKSGYEATGLNPDRSNLNEFLQAETASEAAPPMKVLVATDLVARGIDFQKVRNIILYDMPPNAADLLHRAGRTGRLGTKGRVLLLVARGESKGWIRGLETIVKRGMALA